MDESSLPKSFNTKTHSHIEGVYLELGKMFGNLKKSKLLWILYIPLTILVNISLALTGTCLALIMLGVITFGIPYLFGVRSVKTFLKAGIMIILITGILFGAIYTHFMYNQIYFFEARTVEDTHLVNGTVTPYKGGENTSFNFTVKYIGTESEENITVYVNITGLASKYKKSFELKKNGTIYYYEIILDENIYKYIFAANLSRADEWVKTEEGFGPITMSYSDIMISQIIFGVISLFLNAGIIFFMVIALFYWRKTGQEDRRRWDEQQKAKEEKPKEEEKEEEEGDYECTKCGASVDADATKCWKCGEVFEGEEGEQEKETVEEDYECTECGASVSEDATKCPICGEEFEGMEEEEEKGKEAEKDVKEEARDEYLCTECGAAVDSDATKCPKCGEEFEGEEE